MELIDAWGASKGVIVLAPQQPFQNAENYVRAWMLEADAILDAIGGSGGNRNRHPGILQISVFTPLGQGEARGVEYCTELIAIFSNARFRDLSLEFGPGSIRRASEDEDHLRFDADLGYFWDEVVPRRDL